MTGQQHSEQSQPSRDTAILDRLTAFLNQEGDSVSGADTVELLMQLVDASGRPRLKLPTLEVAAEVTEDRYGLVTARITIGGITLQVFQPVDGCADVCLDLTQEPGYGEGYRVMVTTEGRPVLNPVPLSTSSSPLTDPRIAPPAPPRQ
ncbi:hypothetical protein [Actinoplanes regularis]|uniref:Uncharacterized protein n=1 Tax=Actinoplanes regularis TaxID=52697 RepID=A0A238XJK1_9ACTN|nr:hypothetical protein [Actinoplanes regularis]GIE90500.1 hypothetical protein Are01nite_69800 [Actinoplanes regularis]SNR58768.1 hypothetical protein SAMN06264365_103492 [Actinoplanes regularis]